MVKDHLPSIEALSSNDDARLAEELRLAEVRTQVAVARDALERIEHAVPVSAEEIAKLGCHLVELASALSRARAANDAEYA
jgi:hypothetical protein